MSWVEAFAVFVGCAIAGVIIDLGKAGIRKMRDRKKKP